MPAEEKSTPKAPYVKLFHNGVEVGMPERLYLTKESKEILKKGNSGQGYIYYVDLKTGAIHLLAAISPSKTVDLTTLGPKAQIAERKAILEENMPKDEHGNPLFNLDEFAVTIREKTPSTGSGGGGDLHKNGVNVLRRRDKNLLANGALAGGFWIRRRGDNLAFEDFRTRSTENMQTVTMNPIHTFIFMRNLTRGHEVGHTQVYLREIPLLYLKPILEVFLQVPKEIYFEGTQEAMSKELEDQLLQSLSLDRFENNRGTAIPRSTLLHLGMENNWDPKRIISSLHESILIKGDLSTTEVDIFLRGYFDKNFRENLPLLKDVIDFIKNRPDSTFSKQAASRLDSYFKDLDTLQTLVPPTVALPNVSLFQYAVDNNHLEAIRYFLDNTMLSLCSADDLYDSYKQLIAKDQDDLVNKLPNLQKIKEVPDERLKAAVSGLSMADATKDEKEIERWCDVLKKENHAEVIDSYINRYNAKGDDYYYEVKKEKEGSEEKSSTIPESEVKNKYQLALREYGSVLLFDPNNAHALIGQAQIYYELGQYSDANTCYKKAAEYDPDLFERKPAYKQAHNNARDAARIQHLSKSFLEAHKEVITNPDEMSGQFSRMIIGMVFEGLEYYRDKKNNPLVSQMLQDLLKEIYLAQKSHFLKINQTEMDREEHEKTESLIGYMLLKYTQHVPILWTTLEQIKNEILSTPWEVKEDSGQRIVIDEYGTSIQVPTEVAKIWETILQADPKHENEALQKMQNIADIALNRKNLQLIGMSQEEIARDNFLKKFIENGEFAPKEGNILRTDSSLADSKSQASTAKQSEEDSRAVALFFEYYKPRGTYWNEDRRNHATLTEIIEHANGDHKLLLGEFSGRNTSMILQKVFGITSEQIVKKEIDAIRNTILQGFNAVGLDKTKPRP